MAWTQLRAGGSSLTEAGLREFVAGHFVLPGEPAVIRIHGATSVREHINALWPLLARAKNGPAVIAAFLPAIENEYRFWMDGAEGLLR